MDRNSAVVEYWVTTHYPKILAAALSCLLVLIVIWAFGGFGSQAAYRDATRAVIAQDRALSLDTRNQTTVRELVVGLQAEKLDAVVSGMKKIDLRLEIQGKSLDNAAVKLLTVKEHEPIAQRKGFDQWRIELEIGATCA